MSEQSFIGGRRHRGFHVDRLAHGIVDAFDHALDADDLARRAGLLQELDPRVKVAGMMALVVMAVSVHSLIALGFIFLCAIALAVASHVGVKRLARQVWLGVLLFTGAIALPAIFLVPGDLVARLPLIGWPVTAQGLKSAVYLLARSETAATLALTMILCTPWPHVLKALRSFHVPVMLVVIFGMTHRYIFVFLQSVSQMFEARRSRVVGRLSARERRRIATASAGVLLNKAFDTSTEVHLAMISRGYRGEVHLLDEFRMTGRDWIAMAGFAAVMVAVLLLRGLP